MEDLFNKIIYKSIKLNATDIHFEMGELLDIKIRVLNRLNDYCTLKKEEGLKLLNYIKYRAGINSNTQFTPQTGAFTICFKQIYYLRVSYIPKSDGDSLVIRILNNRKSISIDNISLIHEIHDFYIHLKDFNQGLIVISGPTGSGKSTTLYTIMDYLNENTNKNIITIEDPIEIKKDYATQIEINEDIGLNYATILKQILRHDPDIIVIGEIRDESVAKIAITCALTGHLVLTTLHSSSSKLAIKRLLNLNVSKIDLEDVLIGSISQRIHYINNEVIILSELMDKNKILEYLDTNDCTYNTMHDNKMLLIKQYGYSIEDFKDK